MSRAGGVSLYNSLSGVIQCGGRNGNNVVLGDCLQYNLTTHMVRATKIFDTYFLRLGKRKQWFKNESGLFG